MKKIILLLFSIAAINIANIKATEIPVASEGNIIAALAGASDGDTIVLEDGGTYTVASLSIDKTITIKAEDNSTVTPYISSGTWSFNGAKDVSIIADGVEIESNGANYFIQLSSGDSINSAEIYNSSIHGFGRCLIRADVTGTYLYDVVISNCHVYDFSSGSYRLIYFRDDRTQLNSMLLENSTFDQFDETFLETKSMNVKDITINQCTINGKIGVADGNPVFNIDGGAGSTFTIKNTLITNMEGTGDLFAISGNITDNIENCRFNYDESTYADTANIWSSKINFIKEDPMYADAGNFDLTVQNTSISNDRIGDPRWLPKRIAYVTSGAVADVISNMLDSDDNFDVDVVDGSGDYSSYDLIIGQETFGSGDGVWQAGGSANLRNSIPMIFNKTWAWRNGKAISSAGAAISRVDDVVVTVDAADQSNPLYNGITFTDDAVKLYAFPKGTDHDMGIDVLNGLEMSDKNTLLASVSAVRNADSAIVINDIPAGTQIGTDAADVTGARIIALAMPYPSIEQSRNITSENLTIWRNAAYILTGLTPPTELLVNADYNPVKLIAYVTSGATDVISEMLDNDEMLSVDVVDGSGDYSSYDLVIGQETFGSGDGIWQAGGSLNLRNSVPMIFNKTWAWRNGKAISSAGAAVTRVVDVVVTVDAADQSNPLYSGITFTEGVVQLYGLAVEASGVDVLNGLEMSDKTTLLASVSAVRNADSAIVINDIPKGTQVGTDAADVTGARIIALAMPYPSISEITNITSENLTIWRNAAYILSGLTPPTELLVNEDYVDLTNVMAYWKLDGNADDFVNLSDGILHNDGDSLWISGSVGQAIDFTAGADSAYIEVPTNNIVDFDSTESFTISALVNIETANVSSDINVVFKGATGVTAEGGEGKWYTLAFKTNELRLAVDDNVTKTQLGVDISGQLRTNEWVLVTGVRNRATDSLYIYLDGLEVGRMLDGTENSISSTLPLIIGNNQDINNPFGGKIDDLRMYNKALNAADVKALWESYNFIEYPVNLIAYWKMDDGTGSTVADEIGKSDGTLFNGADSTWATGYIGSALDFAKKTNQDTIVAVNVPGTEVDFHTNDFTISAIVKTDITNLSEQSILSKGTPGVSTGGWYHLAFKENQARFMIWDGSTLVSPEGILPINYPNNEWVHLTAVRDKTNDLVKIYLNGDLLGAAFDAIEDISTDADLSIGTVSQWVDRQFRGSIDEIKFFNNALNAGEIRKMSIDYGFTELIDSKDAFLSEISIDGASISNFSASVKTYNMMLAAGSPIPVVTAVASDDSAIVSVTDATAIPGTATITVTAEDGTESIYTVNFTVPSSDADLTAIILNPDADLNPTFDKDVINYSVELPAGTTTVNVSVTKSDSKASVSGDSDIDVSSGTGVATILVTAEDLTSKTYTVNFTVAIGIQELNKDDISAYYDIYNKNLVINHVQNVSSIEIFDICGNKVVSLNDDINNIINTNELNLNNNSIYLVRITSINNKITSIKFLK